jgi:hypothetical protein
MKNIQLYEQFCINESERDFFRRNYLPTSYAMRSKNYYKLPADATILQRTENFFQKIENRIERMASYGSSLMKQQRSERGASSFNTGVETLFGLPAVVPYVLKRVFSPTKYEFAKRDSIPDDDSVNLKFMRHTNEDFVKNELPYIKNESQIDSHIQELYKRAGVKPKQHPVLDDIARNRYQMFLYHKMYPNRPILQPNN